MNTKTQNLFLKIDQLYDGCILASIAHAIMVATYPNLSNEHSWSGDHYSTQDSGGARATITFRNGFCVGGFRDENSRRVNIPLDPNSFFCNTPVAIAQLALSETFQYLLADVHGTSMPVLTTAIWGLDNQIYSSDSIKNFWKNGGFLLERQVMDVNEGIKSWQEDYEMTVEQTQLLKTLFERKKENPQMSLTLTDAERKIVQMSTENDLEESRIAFLEIGIKMEG